MTQYTPSKYRPDIDGLRAIAVLSVVIYHAFKNTLKGGFVGVDIFFVISGFLITGILIKSLDNQSVMGGNTNLSILHRLISFYARRVRRIFPILIVVLLTCITAGWLIMTPNEYQLLGKHIAGGAVYISNILLWKESGYFDVSSEVKPLLHLWSLGIEEQFYIIWPFVLLVLIKLKLRLDIFIFLFILASCVRNIAMVKTHATGTFYSPPTRFWELAIGGFLACIHYQGSSFWEKATFKTGSVLNTLVYANPHKGNEDKICRDLLSILGLVLIFVSIIAFHTGMHFPGKKALVPTLGTFFLIAAGENAVVNKRLLSLRIMVFIGLISYPLYLWHWPLLSFARIIYGEIPPRTVRIGLILLAFLLSWITYRFIEPPLRWGKHSRIKAVCLFVTLLFIGGVGLKIYNDNGYFTRVETNEYANKIKDIRSLQGKAANTCRNYFPHWGLKDWTDQSCLMQSDDDKKIDIAIIGDSFAGHLFAGMVEQAIKTNHSISVFPASCNLPYLDLTSGSTDGTTYFRAKSHLLHKEAYKFITEHPNIKTVILSHNPECSYSALYDNSDRSQMDKTVILKNGIIRTFDMLKKYDKNVIIVLSNPPFPKFQACQNRPSFISHVFKDDKACTITRQELDSNVARNWYNGIVKEIAKNYSNIKIFDSAEYLCDNTICLLKRDGKALYRDRGHLNEEGSRFISKELIKMIDK